VSLPNHVTNKFNCFHLHVSTKSYTDENQKVTTKVVKRPAVISSYYQAANAIDRHNQLRQGILEYETLWHTQSPWFRLITTLVFGMTLTDAYLLGRHSVENGHCLKRMSIKSFAAGVAKDLANMKCFKDTLSTAASLVPRLNPRIGFDLMSQIHQGLLKQRFLLI
jgi:Transposase IS4